MLVEGLMLKIHPLERPNIVDILERLQDISLSRNVSPKQPLSSLVAPSTLPASVSDPVHAGKLLFLSSALQAICLQPFGGSVFSCVQSLQLTLQFGLWPGVLFHVIG